MSMKLKKIILILMITALLMPTIHAENGFDIALGDYPFLVATFDGCEIISQERIPDGNFTTLHDYTFRWHNATKVTYRNAEGKTDYLMVWQCWPTEEYDVVYGMHELDSYYSDYTKDNKSVVFMEIPKAKYVYGILVDTQNISYTEEELVHGMMNLFAHELTNSGYHYSTPIDVHDASPKESRYIAPNSDQWMMAINDPDWYYDHYDYGDNGYIDEYLYEYHYW